MANLKADALAQYYAAEFGITLSKKTKRSPIPGDLIFFVYQTENAPPQLCLVIVLKYANIQGLELNRPPQGAISILGLNLLKLPPAAANALISEFNNFVNIDINVIRKVFEDLGVTRKLMNQIIRRYYINKDNSRNIFYFDTVRPKMGLPPEEG